VLLVLMTLVDRLGQLAVAGQEHRWGPRVAEHLREGRPPHAGAHDRRAHAGAAFRDGSSGGSAWPPGPACAPASVGARGASAGGPGDAGWASWPALARRAAAGSNGTAGGSLPRSCASRPVMSAMIAAVAPRSTSRPSGWPR